MFSRIDQGGGGGNPPTGRQMRRRSMFGGTPSDTLDHQPRDTVDFYSPMNTIATKMKNTTQWVKGSIPFLHKEGQSQGQGVGFWSTPSSLAKRATSQEIPKASSKPTSVPVEPGLNQRPRITRRASLTHVDVSKEFTVQNPSTPVKPSERPATNKAVATAATAPRPTMTATRKPGSARNVVSPTNGQAATMKPTAASPTKSPVKKGKIIKTGSSRTITSTTQGPHTADPKMVSPQPVTPKNTSPRKKIQKTTTTTNAASAPIRVSPKNNVASSARSVNVGQGPRRSPKPSNQTGRVGVPMARRATLQHVPNLDGDYAPVLPTRKPSNYVKGEIATPDSPPSPTTKQREGLSSRMDEWPQTPAMYHSPMKRAGKPFIKVAASRGHLPDAPSIVELEDTDPEYAIQEVYQSRNTRLYEYARACDWQKVSEECTAYPRDAKCVDELDGTTALHLAIMSRSNPSLRDGELGDLQPAPVEVIEQLVVACPEAAITRCLIKKYTPLTYACLVLDVRYDMADSANLVSILLKHAPQCAYVFTEDGFSALDVHILSYSRFHKGKNNEFEYAGGPDSTLVLQKLLEEKPDLAEARSYKNKIRGPVELLYRSNLEDFKDVDNESKVTDWWAWKWVTLLLKFAPRVPGKANPLGPFSALHAAASLVGCPLPVLSIAANSNPSQVMKCDPCRAIGNLPLHEVCSWVCDQEAINGDPFILRRKALAIECLLNLYPDATKVENNFGETPLQLAVESCTPWDGGLAALVHVYPSALLLPRKLRICNDDNELLISKDVYEDDDSVDSNWVNPLLAVKGMFPFLVAAVVAHVPENKRKARSFVFLDQTPEQLEADIKRKDLESIRSIYGLLRSNPAALALFKPTDLIVDDDDEFEYLSEGSEYTEITYDD